jgi:hypothetical protein
LRRSFLKRAKTGERLFTVRFVDMEERERRDQGQ